MKFVIFVSLLMLGCHARNVATVEKQVSGRVVRIVDGDTYDILFDNNTTKRVRIEGIDAPERGMAFYKTSKDYLGKLCVGQIVRIEQTDIDRYDRIVAKTYRANGSELGLLMIKAGYAWHSSKYSSDKQLAKAEIEARSNRSGLWLDEMPIAPWEWRGNHK